ncbi:MAG: hypothetical protein GY765_22295, partial [bacterium]|nr:hypothetical protein [bacterium]
AVNVEIKRKAVPFRELVKLAGEGTHDMVILGWQGGPDPDFFLYPLFTMTPGNTNRSFYSNPELDALLEKSRGSLDPVKRRGYIRQVQERIFKDSPWIPLYHLRNLAAYNHKIKNLAFSPAGYLIFKDVYIED